MKKTTRLLPILLCIILLIAVVVSACNNTTVTYTLAYNLGEHASATATAPTGGKYEMGAVVALAQTPEAADGYEFAGWLGGGKTYQAGEQFTVSGDVTFTAQWTEVEPPKKDEPITPPTTDEPTTPPSTDEPTAPPSSTDPFTTQPFDGFINTVDFFKQSGTMLLFEESGAATLAVYKNDELTMYELTYTVDSIGAMVFTDEDENEVGTGAIVGINTSAVITIDSEKYRFSSDMYKLNVKTDDTSNLYYVGAGSYIVALFSIDYDPDTQFIIDGVTLTFEQMLFKVMPKAETTVEVIKTQQSDQPNEPDQPDEPEEPTTIDIDKIVGVWRTDDNQEAVISFVGTSEYSCDATLILNGEYLLCLTLDDDETELSGSGLTGEKVTVTVNSDGNIVINDTTFTFKAKCNDADLDADFAGVWKEATSDVILYVFADYVTVTDVEDDILFFIADKYAVISYSGASFVLTQVGDSLVGFFTDMTTCVAVTFEAYESSNAGFVASICDYQGEWKGSINLNDDDYDTITIESEIVTISSNGSNAISVTINCIDADGYFPIVYCSVSSICATFTFVSLTTLVIDVAETDCEAIFTLDSATATPCEWENLLGSYKGTLGDSVYNVVVKCYTVSVSIDGNEVEVVIASYSEKRFELMLAGEKYYLYAYYGNNLKLDNVDGTVSVSLEFEIEQSVWADFIGIFEGIGSDGKTYKIIIDNKGVRLFIDEEEHTIESYEYDTFYGFTIVADGKEYCLYGFAPYDQLQLIDDNDDKFYVVLTRVG